MNVISLLKKDHKKVQGLIQKACDTPASHAEKRRKLLQEIRQELTAHTQAEERLLYPHLIESKEEETRQEGYEATEEHHLVDVELVELQDIDPGDERWLAKMHVLQELVRHHIEEEESEVFEILSDRYEKKELDRMGNEVDEFKKRNFKE